MVKESDWREGWHSILIVAMVNFLGFLKILEQSLMHVHAKNKLVSDCNTGNYTFDMYTA